MKKTVFTTALAVNRTDLPMYRMFKKIADARKDLFFDVFYYRACAS